MSAVIKVLVPEATVNYIENPSFNFNTQGWTAVGSTISRVLNYKLYGYASLKVVTDGLALREGTYCRVDFSVEYEKGKDIVDGPSKKHLYLPTETVTASIYARGNGRVHIRLYTSLGDEWTSEAVSLSDERWTRLEITGPVKTTDNDVRLCIETDDTAQAVTFYVDGAQMELKNYATSYCDGDQPGCRWNITNSYSQASRTSYTREGGRWVEIAGPCRESDDIYMTVLGGLGVPPLQHNIQSWAQSPGSYFQNTRVLNRSATLLFHVKKVDTHRVTNINASKLHELRQQLVDIFKPDLTAGGESFWFSYKEGQRELLIRMRYEAGLEGDWDIRNQWIQSFPVRFLVVDPFWVENNCHAQALLFKDTTVFSHVAAKVDGAWTTMKSGLNDVVHVLQRGLFDEIFAGGAFTKNKLETITLDNFAQWSGDGWLQLGSGADATIEGIDVSPAGRIFITGSFLNIGGVAAKKAAMGVYLSGVGTIIWSALGGGLDSVGAVGYCVLLTSDTGAFYGGTFTSVDGIAVTNIARWDGLSWHAIGAGGGVDDSVYSLAYNPITDKLYLGGNFLKNSGSGTNDLNYIAVFDYTTNIISALGSGFDGSVTSVDVSPTGIVYAAGTFTKSGTTSLNHVAKWDGTSWTPLGAGLTGSFLRLKVVSDQFIIATGSITLADSIAVHNIAYWNGTNWVAPDIEFNSDILEKSLVIGDDIYLCGDIDPTTSCNHSALNYVTNYGTAEVFPTIWVDGPGHLVWIENVTTKKKVYLDLTIYDNEKVFIDFGQKKIYSSLRPNLAYTIVNGSDFTDFSLVPGENKLAVLMTDDVGSTMHIYYQPRHWSADATIDAEAL